MHKKSLILLSSNTEGWLELMPGLESMHELWKRDSSVLNTHTPTDTESMELM